MPADVKTPSARHAPTAATAGLPDRPLQSAHVQRATSGRTQSSALRRRRHCVSLWRSLCGLGRVARRARLGSPDCLGGWHRRGIADCVKGEPTALSLIVDAPGGSDSGSGMVGRMFICVGLVDRFRERRGGRPTRDGRSRLRIDASSTALLCPTTQHGLVAVSR